MTEGMKWRPPPPNVSYDWESIGRQLKAHPNEWLLIFEEGPVSIINAVRQGVNGVRPPYRRGSEEPGFQVRTRNNHYGPPKTADLYLRWHDPSIREE